MVRFLGLVFVVLLVIGGVGYFRGWYSAEIVDASGRPSIAFTFDRDQIQKDAGGAAARLGELSAALSAKLDQLAKSSGGDRVIEGELTAVDVANRTITVATGSETVDLRVPADAPLSEVTIGMRAKVKVVGDGTGLRVASIDFLR